MKADHFFRKGRRDPKLCADCGRRPGEHPSKLEADFDAALERAGLQEGLEREVFFALRVGRKWHFDRCWPALRLAVELDGGRHMHHGGHTTQVDRDRDNFAQLDGWLVLRFDDRQVRLGLAVRQLAAAIQLRAAPAADRARLRQALTPEMFPPPAVVKEALRGSRRSSPSQSRP